MKKKTGNLLIKISNAWRDQVGVLDNREPNCTQVRKIIQIQCQIKSLLNEFAQKLSSRINLDQIKRFNYV